MSTTTTAATTSTTITCLDCSGTGISGFGDECVKCDGTGQKRTARITVHAPARNAASEKQIAFVESLIERLRTFEGDTEANALADSVAEILASCDITKKVASDLINVLKPAVDAAFARRRQAQAEQTRKAAATVEPGVYTNDRGEYAVVQKARQSGNLYAKTLDFETGDTDYTPGLIGRITREGWRQLTEDERAAWGREHVRCMDCGRALTNELSRELGIGPICRSK